MADHDKPWDARLAYRLILPLQNSTVTPNHLTTVRLMFGIAACLALAKGGYAWTNIGALCFVISNFLDHTDGELARLTGNMTQSGHYYDLASDALVNILLFIGLGIGLTASGLGQYAVPMGVLAGIAVAGIFHMRLIIENHAGKAGARQPNFAGFEAEDVLYLLPAVTLTDQAMPFLALAAIGAPLFAVWVLREYLKIRRGMS